MKYLFTCIVAMFLIANVHAQYQFSGSVISETNEPIIATIYFPQLEKGAQTDLDGNFSVENIPQGTYKVVVSALGFATVSEKLSFSEEKSITRQFTMAESAVEMEAIIISTPFHKLQSDNVMRVERVSTDELSAHGAVTLADGITNIPGVSSVSTGSGIGKPVIRGLSSNRVLTYTQGIRLENQQFGDEHGLGVNEAGIESVEVIKGPASLLYGSDALGGVLYLNPEKFAPAGEKHVDASSSYMSNTYGFKGNTGVQISTNKLKFLGRFAYVTHSDYQTGDDIGVTNSRFNETDFKAGVQYQTYKFKSTLRYNFNVANLGIPEEIGAQTSTKSLSFPYQAIDNHILSLDNTLYFGDSSLDIKLGYLFNDRREFEEEEHEESTRAANEPLAALQLKLNTYSYDIKYNLPDYGKFETIVGVQGMYQTNENFGEEFLIPDATTADIGVLATTHYHLEKVDLQAGLRFDRRNIQGEAEGALGEEVYFPEFDRSFNSFNAALGAKVDVTDKLLARINLASGFRAPNLAELASNGVHEGTNRFEIGNVDLKNEQNLQTDVSLSFANEHIEIFANGFYNAISNYIFITPTGEVMDENLVFEYVQDDANLYGGEFGMHLHPHPLDWLHLESSFETVTGKQSNDNYLPLIPANSLTNTVRVEFKDGKRLQRSNAFIRLQNTFAQKNVSDFETTTDAYNLLSIGGDTSIALNKLEMKLGLNVTNLTNEVYISHLSRLKEDGIPNMGRSININLKVAL